ncbi:tetratricopeptide repeat protein [Aestuariirhabdus sp. LZHN29]|uniref:tetratricopeptide repeat protein n=1 Tax=Aestuariirhabdus sp. LZHN29 TaxID=3417462 RepID=UPI003CF0632C
MNPTSANRQGFRALHRVLLGVGVVAVLTGCGSYRVSSGVSEGLDLAYKQYADGDCVSTMQTLSKVERMLSSYRFLQPEVSLLRGLCLERQGYFMDAMETYNYILNTFPQSEYAYRAKARLKVLSVKPTS